MAKSYSVRPDLRRHFQSSTDFMHALNIYDVLEEPLAQLQELCRQDGRSLSRYEMADYLGLYVKKEGSRPERATSVPYILAISAIRNNVPAEYLPLAFQCGFKSYVAQTELIGAHMDGILNVEKLQSYRKFMNTHRFSSVRDMLSYVQTGVPFEYMESIFKTPQNNQSNLVSAL